MKKINLFLISYALVFFTVSCSSDDDGDVLNNPGTLSIGDTEIQLKAGALENIESFNGITSFDLILLDSNITIVQGQPFPENNVVNAINFELFTDASQDLAEGVYLLDDSFEITPQTIGSVALLENVDVNSETEIDEPPFFVEGSLEIISNGPQYEIEFSGVDNLGRDINGSYQGTLTVIEE